MKEKCSQEPPSAESPWIRSDGVAGVFWALVQLLPEMIPKIQILVLRTGAISF